MHGFSLAEGCSLASKQQILKGNNISYYVVMDLTEKTGKDSSNSFAFRVKIGEYELEINGSRNDVLKAINELPTLMGNVYKAFDKLKPKRTTTLTVKTAPGAEEKRPTRKYPKIPQLDDCGKAVLKVLETDWGKWRPRTLQEIKEALKANNLRFPGRKLAGFISGLVRSGKVKRWKTDKGYVYILAEEEILA